MKIPGGNFRLSQLRNRVLTMEKNLEGGKEPQVNPYPDSWSQSQVRDANQTILRLTDKDNGSHYTGDATLKEISENQPKLAKFSSTAAKIAGGMLLGGLAVSGAAIFGLASPALGLLGVVGMAAAMVPAEIAGKSSQFHETTDHLKMWGQALDKPVQSPETPLQKVGTVLGQHWQMSPANK